MPDRRPAVGLVACSLLWIPACKYTPSALDSWPKTPSCGRYESMNEPASGDQRRKNRCLLDAFVAGRPAELIVTAATIDSGPITTYLRVLGPHRVEVFIDETKDSEGSQRWVHLACDRVAEGDGGLAYADFGSCREISVDEKVS